MQSGLYGYMSTTQKPLARSASRRQAPESAEYALAKSGEFTKAERTEQLVLSRHWQDTLGHVGRRRLARICGPAFL